MAKYISCEDAQKIICGWCGVCQNPTLEDLEKCDDICPQFAKIPAADVRPVVKGVWKHVQWVVDEEWQDGGYWISRCSNCSMPYHTETPFCPHCGADMREES